MCNFSRRIALHIMAGALIVFTSASQAIVLGGGAVRDFDLTDFGTLNDVVRIRNLSNSDADVSLELKTQPVTGPVTPGFRLLDLSLTTTVSGVDKGQIRARYGIRVGSQRLRDLGIRASQLRLMQFDPNAGRWLRASRFLRRDNVAVRRILGTPRFQLGTFGVDTQSNLVWGVTDRDGLFAVAAQLSQLPVPGTPVLLLVAGLLLTLGGLMRARDT